ncbi:MAG: IS1 family transposase [Mycoplasmataceae bacterium]|nr:IS1 family transposase [Mycoplasmataceae bacterium]
MEKKEEIDHSNISTTLIERENLNLRHDNKRLSRKTIAYSKKDKWLQSNLDLYKSFHNFVKTHHSLKKMNLQKIKDNVWKKYKNMTPIMSIGLTDHIWSLKELLTYPYHKNISI